MDASSSTYRCAYDAFLSFRGADTRTNFTDHLYEALKREGIYTFRDDDEIERGENIDAELARGIKESRVSIIVFSKDYASSRWCLEELVKIMERRKIEGHTVLPVFYHVLPSDVRKQSESFAKSFAKHEERFKKEKVDEWRRALKDVADLGGMVLEDGYESQFIQDIVEKIGEKLDYTWNRRLRVDLPYVVGLDYRVEPLNKWLGDESNDVGIAVICGMGGIGKTTIAKTAYNQNFYKFQGSSFLEDIRATSEKPNGFVHLQMKLLSDIQKKKTKEVIYSPGEGIRKIERVVRSKRVLIALDDVDDSDQLNQILGMREWFYPGSKIVITTRREDLLKDDQVYKVFEVERLKNFESLKLFSWHAFKQTHPMEGYMKLSSPIVKHCGGIPLALQVLGSSLSGKNADVWENALQNLDMITDGKIQKILRISFDSLQEQVKVLFLHIVCFFIGKHKDFVATVLDRCDFDTKVGIQKLVDRHLVKINVHSKLIMNQLLQDMGRATIREESPDPGKRSRVWDKDASGILKKSTGTRTVKGLVLNFSSTNPTHVSKEVDFKTEAFRKMKNLEFLLLDNVKLSGSSEYFPKNLIWLSWQGFHFKSIPVSFCLEDLIVLDLRKSSLQHLWKGTRFLPRLKILDLSHSHNLMSTPEFSQLPNLERLILRDCIKLVEVGESIGHLERLVFLNLEDCKNLMKLPTRISTLKSLQEIILAGCSMLVLHDNTTARNQSHSSASDMVKLSFLSTISWKPIWSLWLWLWLWLRLLSARNYLPSTGFSLANLPHSLGILNLSDCNLSNIPNNLCILSSLKDLNLSRNPILCLPENMKSLTMLQTLLLDNCTNLIVLPELPPSLRSLEANYCTSLTRITNLPNLFKSLLSFVSYCEKLVQVEDFLYIKPLRSVDIEMIKYMGLLNLVSIGSTHELEMINYWTLLTTKGPLQALYECGIFSIFLDGSEFLDPLTSFGCRRIWKLVSGLSVPSHPNCKIRGLKVCVIYARKSGYSRDRYCSTSAEHSLKVSNQTKGLMWTYSPLTVGFPKEKEDIIWLSHFRFENNELEVGDEVHVSVHMLDFSTKEIGVQLVYEEENKETAAALSQNISVVGDVSMLASKYEMWTGKYFLCNHRYHTHQELFRRSRENRAHLDFSFQRSGSTRFHYLFDHQGLGSTDSKMVENVCSKVS